METHDRNDPPDKWDDVTPIAVMTGSIYCSAMACTDSLECFGYWDLANLVVSNRGIYTS
jgi:hypothetical protein